MKRLFAISFGLTALTANIIAQDIPAAYPDVPFNKVSPDGKLLMTDEGTIIDLSNNQKYGYSEQYSDGSGNAISNTGTIVGYKIGTEQASIWKNGKWSLMPQAANKSMSYANGITPDGKRIVGTVAPDQYGGGYEGLMLVPCYWDMLPDGSYSEIKYLPYPSKDFTGRSPQYITAVRVSDDGKVIAGQVHDYSGFINQPVVYIQDQAGDWSYKYLLEDLFYPEGFELPEDPGDGPMPQDFMTQEEIENYDRAVFLWEMIGGEPETYPDIYDFMTEQEFQDYYETAMTWDIESSDYYAKLTELFNAVPNFSYNNVLLTPDGLTYATTDTKGFYDEYLGASSQNYTPYCIDITSGTYNKYPPVDDIHITLSSIAADGTLFGQTRNTDYNIYNAYILPKGASVFVSLYDYIKEIDPELGQWMTANMVHNYQAINLDSGITYIDTAVSTGIPYVTPDMSLIALATYNFWNDLTTYYGYLISPDWTAGVGSIENDSNLTISALSGGKLLIKGEASAIEIYAINGAKVFSAENPDNIVSTNLPKGIYVVKCKNPSGVSSSSKLIIK